MVCGTIKFIYNVGSNVDMIIFRNIWWVMTNIILTILAGMDQNFGNP